MASQLYYHLLPIHTIINTSIKFTQKRRRLMALLLPCNRWVAFLVLSFPLVFGAPSVQAQTPGPSQSSGLTLNRQQAGSQSRLDFVNVKFEVDGKEKKKNFKIVLYLNNQIIEPLLVEGGFLVPPELKNQEHVDVRFKSGRYDLFFDAIYSSKFQSDWIIGVDTKPFDPANASDEEAKNTEIIRYINFEARVADGTRMVVRELKPSPVAIPQVRVRTPKSEPANHPKRARERNPQDAACKAIEVTMAVVPKYPLTALHSHTSGEVVLQPQYLVQGQVTEQQAKRIAETATRVAIDYSQSEPVRAHRREDLEDELFNFQIKPKGRIAKSAYFFEVTNTGYFVISPNEAVYVASEDGHLTRLVAVSTRTAEPYLLAGFQNATYEFNRLVRDSSLVITSQKAADYGRFCYTVTADPKNERLIYSPLQLRHQVENYFHSNYPEDRAEILSGEWWSGYAAERLVTPFDVASTELRDGYKTSLAAITGSPDRMPHLDVWTLQISPLGVFEAKTTATIYPKLKQVSEVKPPNKR